MFCVELQKWIDYEEYTSICAEKNMTIHTERVYFGGWPVMSDSAGNCLDLEY